MCFFGRVWTTKISVVILQVILVKFGIFMTLYVGVQSFHKSSSKPENKHEISRAGVKCRPIGARTVCAMVLGVASSCVFGWVLYSVHENQLWFSHISQVEKEISFRTESGLYYSYMKDIITATVSWLTQQKKNIV